MSSSSSRNIVHDSDFDDNHGIDKFNNHDGQRGTPQVPPTSTFAGKLDLAEFANKSHNNSQSLEKGISKGKERAQDKEKSQKTPDLNNDLLFKGPPAYSSPTTRAMKRRLMHGSLGHDDHHHHHRHEQQQRRGSVKDSASSSSSSPTLVRLTSRGRRTTTAATNADKTRVTATTTITTPPPPPHHHTTTTTSTTTPPVNPTVSNFRDTIYPDLILLFVGVNPGIQTGLTGHSYAHPSNLYWKLLHQSGITVQRHPPRDTYVLPELYNIGNTNLVVRPTRDASSLTRAEMDEGARIVQRKIAHARPEAVCFVGKGVWEAVWRVNHRKSITKEEFRYGWQHDAENIGVADGWSGSRVFVATTTSGLAAGMTPAEKLDVWMQLGEWVKARRRDRKPLGTAGSAPLVE